MGGIKELKKLPDLVFVVDLEHDKIAVREAKKMGIPIAAIVDTNANPQEVDIAIPANEDAISSLRYILSYLASKIAK